MRERPTRRLDTAPPLQGWTRRWPHCGFSRVRRISSSRSALSMRGGPTWAGKVHFLVIRRRCQDSRVAGVTSRWGSSSRGSSRHSADRIARSGQDRVWLVHLAARNGEFVAEHEYLEDQTGPTPGQQRQPTQYSHRDYVDHTDNHGEIIIDAGGPETCRSQPYIEYWHGTPGSPLRTATRTTPRARMRQATSTAGLNGFGPLERYDALPPWTTRQLHVDPKAPRPAGGVCKQVGAALAAENGGPRRFLWGFGSTSAPHSP
jgi:hypothetical protein